MQGFYYIENYLSNDEAVAILSFLENDEKAKWEPVGSSANSREVIQYGYSYAYNRSGTEKLENIPEILSSPISLDRLENLLKEDSKKLKVNSCIVNKYKPGQGIAAHVDHPKQFGEAIICLSLGSDIMIDFKKRCPGEPGQPRSDKKKSDGKEAEVISKIVKANSLYIMTGESRYEYTHSIAPRKSDKGKKRSERISLTYRWVL